MDIGHHPHAVGPTQPGHIAQLLLCGPLDPLLIGPHEGVVGAGQWHRIGRHGSSCLNDGYSGGNQTPARTQGGEGMVEREESDAPGLSGSKLSDCRSRRRAARTPAGVHGFCSRSQFSRLSRSDADVAPGEGCHDRRWSCNRTVFLLADVPIASCAAKFFGDLVPAERCPLSLSETEYGWEQG